MADTTRLGLPLLAPAQSQKHVTVNESLVRLDALVNMTITSVDAISPPSSPVEGDVHHVGAGASGDWFGEDGKLAVFLNGGWAFLSPASGWQAWSDADGARVAFDGAQWQAGAGSFSPNGAGFVHRTIEVDHDLGSGSVSTVSQLFPAGVIAYGVTARVLSDIGGATALELGVQGATDRYGSGIGTVTGSWARGVTGSPLTYFSDTDIVVGAVGGDFDGTGSIRIAAHVAELTLPRA